MFGYCEEIFFIKIDDRPQRSLDSLSGTLTHSLGADMTYDWEKLVLEEIPDFAALARLIRPIYPHPEIRKRRTAKLPGYVLVEIYDADTDTCLGNWEEDLESFDFAGAESSVVNKLDAHLRQHFKMKKKVWRRWIPPGAKRPVGRDFAKYHSPIPIERPEKPRKIKSLEEFYGLISNTEISVGIQLGGGLGSTHNFEAYKNHILHNSMVDGSYSQYTKRQFERSFYAKAILLGAMILDGIVY